MGENFNIETFLILEQKEALINAMIDHAIGQHTLPSLAKGKGKKKQTSKNDGMIQSQLSFGQKPKTVSQLKRLREMAMERLGLSYPIFLQKKSLMLYRSLCQDQSKYFLAHWPSTYNLLPRY